MKDAVLLNIIKSRVHSENRSTSNTETEEKSMNHHGKYWFMDFHFARFKAGRDSFKGVRTS